VEARKSRSRRAIRGLALVLLVLGSGLVLNSCFVGVRHEGCWHEGWRGPEGYWHPGHWGPCR
jgi:hypothetical protein